MKTLSQKAAGNQKKTDLARLFAWISKPVLKRVRIRVQELEIDQQDFVEEALIQHLDRTDVRVKELAS